MKKINLVISVITLACAITVGAISDSHAIKLCQLDWLESWRTASGYLPNSRVSYSYGNSYSTGNGGIGIWTVTSNYGGGGAYHTVSGQAFCSSTNTGTYTDGVPSYSGTNAYCWCRMTSPNLGASWVYLGGDGVEAGCTSSCAYICAVCIQQGAPSYNSCTRSAVLTLP
jgi:hypothetical protein